MVISETLRKELDQIPSRVAAGAAWADESFPGWESHVDLDTLQLDDSRVCALCQISRIPNYYQAKDSCDLTCDDTVHFGFYFPISHPLEHKELERYYWELDTAWHEEVRRRQAAIDTGPNPPV